MKKRFILPIVVVFCFLSFCRLISANLDTVKDNPNSAEALPKRLEVEVEKLVHDLKIPGANIGIWIPGELEWEGSFGVANLETKEKLSLNDYFRIGSLTKTFIGTAVLELVDQGKISLDDKISKYVKDVPNGDLITLRELGNMTSGLANFTANDEWVENELFKHPNRSWTSEELLSVAFKMPILFEPGKGWLYCNTNVVLLGLVIEKVSGLTLEQYLEKYIFCPLELKHTFYPSTAKMPEPYANGYTKQTVDGSEADATFRNPSYTNAAGQMISRFDDLKVWAQALGTGKLLSPEAFKERLVSANVPPNMENKRYAFLIGYNNGWLMHTGTLPGYNVTIGYLPEKKAIVVCMVNSDITLEGKSGPAPTVVEAILKIAMPNNVLSE